jgi:peroxiredoxin
MKEVATRSIFIISQDGRIQYVWVSESPGNLPPFDEVKKAVEKLG